MDIEKDRKRLGHRARENMRDKKMYERQRQKWTERKRDREKDRQRER